MTAYETTATIQAGGELSLQDVPFDAGTQVDVWVVPKRRLSVEDFRAAWNRLCHEFRTRPDLPEPTDEEIQHEIDAYRAGR